MLPAIMFPSVAIGRMRTADGMFFRFHGSHVGVLNTTILLPLDYYGEPYYAAIL